MVPMQGIELRPRAPFSQFQGPRTVVQHPDFQTFMFKGA